MPIRSATWMKRTSPFKDNLSKLTQERIDSLSRPVTIKEIKSTINNLWKQKAPGPDAFTGEFYQAFEEGIIPVQQELPFTAVENVKWYGYFTRWFGTLAKLNTPLAYKQRQKTSEMDKANVTKY